MTPRRIRRAVTRGGLAALLVGPLLGPLLAACATPGATTRHDVSAAQMAACRQRADEVYAKQNRGELYGADTYASTTRDSPFSTSGLPGITTRGLGGEYARDNMISDCVNDAAGNVGNSATDPVGPTGVAETPGHLPRTLSPLAVPPSP